MILPCSDFRLYLIYGSVEDVHTGRCPLTRWQVLNLSRVYLSPSIQQEGGYAHPEGLIGPSLLPFFYDRSRQWRCATASYIIEQALDLVVFDYLKEYPPVWMQQPYELATIMSYCDTRRHKGIIYRAAHFTHVRTNARGIETYQRAARPLTMAEHAIISARSKEDPRARRLRSQAAGASQVKQLVLCPFSE